MSRMPAPDHFDRQDAEEDDDTYADRITCARCGAQGLHWQAVVKADGEPGCKLFTERNRPHKCEPEPTADAFGAE